VACNKHWVVAEDKHSTGQIATDRLCGRGCHHFRAALCLVASPIIGAAIVVTRSSADLAPATAAAVSVVLSPQSSEPLLLGVCVDVCADDESNDVEEGHPSSLGKELLSKSQRDGGHDPADLHDGPEASLDGCANLVECSGTGNKGHRDEVDAVLDR
jgi:hypothetical protein